MNLSESYKKRIQDLSGIKSVLSEDVKLIANLGRSDAGTLSWYGEEYLLNLGSEIVSQLDKAVNQEPDSELLMSKSSTKMAENTLVTKLTVQKISGTEKTEDEFILTLSVEYEKSSNTIGTVTFKGVTNNFNLSSKHSKTDLDLFKGEIVNSILNIVKLQTQEKKEK